MRATGGSTRSKKYSMRNRAVPTRPSEAALYMLTDRSLLQSVTAFASGVPYFVYQVKQQLACVREKSDTVPPQDVKLWQTAVCTGDRQTLEALAVLSKTKSLGPVLCKVLKSILGYALLHSRDMALLEWLNMDDVFSEDLCLVTKEDEKKIGEQGDIALVEWLWTRNYELDSSVAIGAASGGHLALIQRLHENETHTFGYEGGVIKEAVAHGHLDIVKYIHENRQQEFSLFEMARFNLLDGPSAKGDLEMVQYIHENGVGGGLRAPIEGAAANGHLEIVKYLYEHNLKTALCYRAIDKAIENRHPEIAQFLFEECQQRCSGKAMEEAMKRGDVELLQTMSEYCDDGALQYALLAAAELGSTKFMRFLYAKVDESSCRLPREDLVNNAARAGNLELVKFFHEHTHFRFSAQTMHFAALANHLHVVKFLHEHRSEGCKVNTLFECDQQELVRVLAFLCSQRPMRNPAKAITRARCEGRLLLAAKLEYGANAATTYVYR